MITRKEEHILLCIVLLENTAYLVNIRQKLQDITGKYLDVGSINKTLKKLERDDYLKSDLGKPQPVRGGKAIKYYTLTEKAYQALSEINALHERFWKKVAITAKNK